MILVKPFFPLLSVVILLWCCYLIFELLSASEELISFRQYMWVFVTMSQFTTDVSPGSEAAESFFHEWLQSKCWKDKELARSVYHVCKLHEINLITTFRIVKLDWTSNILRVDALTLSILHEKLEDVELRDWLIIVSIKHVKGKSYNFLPCKGAEIY